MNCTEVEIEEKETKPPSLYTDGSLIVAMSNVSNHVTDEKLKLALKDKGIGTVATRPQIISKLEDEKMMQYKGKTLDITEKGKQLIETLQKTNIRTLTSVEYTALWEYRLTMIEKKKYAAKEFMQQIEQFTKMIVEEAKSTEIKMPSNQQENIGNCLVCGSELREGQKQYFCSKKSEGCLFFIWKQQYGKNLTAKMISMILTKKQTNWLSFKNRKGVTYQARLLLPDPLDNGKLSLDFKNKR